MDAWLRDAPGVSVMAGYVSSDGEIDVEPALAAARRCGISTAYPAVEGDDLVFRLVDDTQDLVSGRWGLREPRGRADQVDASALDVVLVPLVAFDDTGRRLGRGRGYYDRSFGFLRSGPRPARPLLVGVAHDCQRVPELRTAPHDVPLDAVLTPTSGPLTLPPP